MEQHRIAYLGKIQLSDVDLSYLHAAQQQMDITYILEVNPRLHQGPAFHFPALRHKTGIFPATELYPELKALDGFIDLSKFYISHTYGRFWVLKSVWLNILLLIFLIRGHYNILHMVWPPNIFEFPLYVLRRRMVQVVHDPFPHNDAEHDTFIVRLRRWCAFHLIDKFVILNQTQREQFLSYYNLRPEQVLVSRLSSYDYLQSVTPSCEAAHTGPIILFAGKISPYKGIEYLMEAMPAVHQRCPEAKLIVAGGGQYHFDTQPYDNLDYIELRNRFIPNNELVSLIQQAYVVVCPYTNATQSGVVMSAFAFARPVIVTRVGGLAEMVGDGKMGIVVEAKDTAMLAQAIIQILEDKALHQTLHDNIRQNYGSGKLSWSEIATEMSAFYNK